MEMVQYFLLYNFPVTTSMQFLNPEILSFHLMYDAACSTAGWGYS